MRPAPFAVVPENRGWAASAGRRLRTYRSARSAVLFRCPGSTRPLGLDGVLLAEHAQLVPDAEIVRDVHPHGAGHTVPAAGAANLDAAVQLVGYAFHSGILGGGKRFKMAKGGKVVGQLILSTHAGEDHMHIFVAAHQRSAQEHRWHPDAGRAAVRRRLQAGMPECRP